uniref:Uncharacterized protein n=1 Tax=Eptatretus burgeri TaxID=7764 RepID=A0A8C4QJ46_EPTBU
MGTKLFVKPTWNTTFCRADLSQKLYKHTIDFNLEDPNMFLLKPEYNCLNDPYLENYFNNPRRLNCLRKEGHVIRDNQVPCSLAEFNKYNEYLRRVNMFDWRKYGQTKHTHKIVCAWEKHTEFEKDVEASKKKSVSSKLLENTGSSKMNFGSSSSNGNMRRQNYSHLVMARHKEATKKKPLLETEKMEIKHASTKCCTLEKHTAFEKDVKASTKKSVSSKLLENTGSSKKNFSSSSNDSQRRQNYSQ